MYDQSSLLIAGILLVSMTLAIEGGYRVGRRSHNDVSEEFKGQIRAIQASLLGVLALLLGFAFSLALQRYDSRSKAVVDEANALGTAYLRAQLLPPSMRGEMQTLLRQYVDLRVQASTVTLKNHAQRDTLQVQVNQLAGALWNLALRAAEEDARPVTSGLFIQALNDVIDSYGRRSAELDRHVPELVLFLMYATFLLTGTVVGYASGVSGQRAPFATYMMVVLIVLLVFTIIDLDRPRRGLIEVSQQSLIDLQTAVNARHP